MPIKKWITSLDKENVKICPYCANEISVRAKKCKYCWEFLDDEYGKMRGKESKKPETHINDWSKLSALNVWKALYRCCIVMFVLLWVAFLWWYFNLDFIDSEGFGLLDILLGLTLLILQMVWSNKSYHHLLNKGCKDLHFTSAWWPTRWWICPIACFFIPFQAVKDIYKTYNEKLWIVWWRWACYLWDLILSIMPEEVTDNSPLLSLLLAGSIIAEYILLFIIVKDINKSLENED